MSFIHIQPGADSGRIGPFWWVNGVHQAHVVTGFTGTTHDPSRHLVWRSGGCGWLDQAYPLINPLRWHIIQVLS
jgi:hypothetical protein